MKFLDTFPQTNARAFFGLVLLVVYVLALIVCMVRNTVVNEPIMYTLAGVLTSWQGIAVAGFKFKRDSAWSPPQTASEVGARQGAETQQPPVVVPPRTLDQGEH